jgi:hypothetical protein
METFFFFLVHLHLSILFFCSGLAFIIFFPEGSHRGWGVESSYLERQAVSMWPLATVQLNLNIFFFFFCGYIFLIYKFCLFFLYDSLLFFNISFIFHRSASLIGSCPKVAHA